MLLLFAAALGASAAPVSVKNEVLTATYDPVKDTLSATGPGGRLVGAKLRGSGGTARMVAAVDATFGKGQAIEVTRPDGSVDRVALFPKLPFLLISSTLKNGGAEALVLNKIPLLTTGLDLGVPAADLRAWGTGGLTAVDKHPGSYVYLAVTDPKSRRGAVGAWLTHDRGSGVVFSSVTAAQATMTAQVEYGRLRILPGATAETETFALALCADARDGLEGWADAVARHYKIKLRPQPSGYCTWYADQNGGAGSEKSMGEFVDFVARELKPFGFSVVQIDDGWQLGDAKGNGPNKWFLGARPNGPYAGGMKATADRIHAAGLTPGIWFMPFAGTSGDPAFAEHQDWFIKRPDGKPYDTAWGGTSLDMTVPGAKDHLREVAKACRAWGYTYYKMDGLYTGIGCNQVYINDGYVDDKFGDSILADPAKTNVEAYRDGFKLLREAAGDDVFFLGCCISQNMRSFGASIGLVDAMRIGPDNGTSWSTELDSPGTGRGLLAGPASGTRRYFMQGRIWYNDPDPVYIRTSLALNRAQMIASWAAVTGQLTINSDWLPSAPPERLDILKRIMPAHGRHARPLDLFEHDLPRVWTVGDAGRTVVGIFNWEAKQTAFNLAAKDLALPAGAAYAAYDFWGKQLLPLQRGGLKLSVPSESCRVLSVLPLSDHPQVLSTSRHLTQGLVDLSGVKWDKATSTLSGVSKVVGGDAYELRVLLVGDKAAWSVTDAVVAAADKAAGVTVSRTDGQGLATVTLKSTASREVAWSVKVKPASLMQQAPPAATELTASADPFKQVDLSWTAQPGLSYEVARDGDEAVPASGASYHDADAKPGTTYTYAVTSVNLMGQRSKPATLKVVVPAEPKLGPRPPKPDVSIMGLKAVSATTGWGSIHQGQSVAGNPLRLGKETFTDGVGTHAPSKMVYTRRPEWSRFVAVVGVDDEERAQDAASIDFRVLSDNGQGEPTLLAQSPVLRYGKVEVWHFDVPLPADCQRVVLELGDGGDGYRCDHGDWCDAGFIALAGKPDAAYDVGTKLAGIETKPGRFGDFDCYDFTFEGRAAKIVKPKVAIEGHPWSWRTEFFGHEPQTDLALLASGYHIVYVDVFGLMGGPPAMAIYDKFYDLLQKVGLAKKGSFIGMSRGGLYAYNWAIRRPETVSSIYGDNPVLDTRSWPGKIGDSKSAGSAGDWQLFLKAYGFTQEQGIAFGGQPVDNLEPLAKAGIPILNVVGDADTVVPAPENSNLVEERYPKLGGKITVIHKPGLDHHPHSLPDPTRIIRFIIAADQATVR